MPTAPANSFGRTLRDLRTDANKTMGDIARLLGCSVSYISDVELGRRHPFKAESCTKIEALLGLTPGTLRSHAHRT